MTIYFDALKGFADIGDRRWTAFTLQGFGDLHHDHGDHGNAIKHHEQAAELFKQLGNTHQEAIALNPAANVRQLLEHKAAR